MMALRLSHSSASVSSHLDEYSGREDGESQRKDPEASTLSNSATATSMSYLPHTLVLCELRHEGVWTVSKWRPKDRMKTGCVALVLCLNIGVDPPDVIKISPCARMECWIDPFSMAAPKALETIGKKLHSQYERWQPRARYRPLLDPTVEEVKKLCHNSRKYARSERILFHYNGHGVPNLQLMSYTQYIPLPVGDLDSWLKTPSIYVFDCSAAGRIVKAFNEQWSLSGATPSTARDCILLAACEAHETLPQSAEFPADVFTSCLTTPIKMALRWFCSRSLLHDSLDYSLIDRIPGRQNDRKTLLGNIFQKLFRQDLLVASLFRNFLLAERIMDAWDMAAEICLSKLSSLFRDPMKIFFQPSPFFTEQLTAFEVWLDHGSEHKKPPEQLPIVLQVLLSQSHRFRALVLLGRFLDMGPWAVDQALSVGIFPYVLKLLQTTAMELRQILVFIWTKILALDKSCQVDLVKDGGHTYFIKFLDSMDAYPEQRAMAAFVLAVISDGHRQGQEACIQSNLIHVCLRHLQLLNPHDAQIEPLLLQWLCLCLGKLWEDFPEAQIVGLQSDAHAICAPLLSEPQPEVRAAAIFALGNLFDVGSGSSNGLGGDDDRDDDEKIRPSSISFKTYYKLWQMEALLSGLRLLLVSLGRFAFAHNKHLKSIAAIYWKPQSNSLLSSLPSLANIRSPSQYMQSGISISSQIGPVLRVGSDNMSTNRDGRVSTSSPLASAGILNGSPLSDDSSQHSDSGLLLKENAINGVMNFSRTTVSDNPVYSQCVLAMYTLAKDPSPRVSSLGRRTLSIIGIEQVVTKTVRPNGGSIRQGDLSAPTQSPGSNLAGLARSSSWFDMSAGHVQLPFRTPPVSPPRQNFLSGMRRVCSLDFRQHQLNSPESGLADPLLGSSGFFGASERSLLPQSTIYSWSCGHFSRPLLTATDDNEEISPKREDRERYALDRIAKCQHSSGSKLSNQIASWDTRFETGTKAALLLPFSPIVVAADENERIRVWNYEEATSLNSFENHEFPDKGISKLCLLNELDDSLLLVASSDGNVRIWKDYALKSKQMLVTAFSSIQGHRPGVRVTNAVVDWQQQSGYLYASAEASPIQIWDLDKEQLSASQVHGGQLAAGFVDGSVRLFDIRTPEMLVSATRPHTQSVERVVGIGFQPGLDSGKIVSASQAGDIQFLDIRNRTAYLTIDAHRAPSRPWLGSSKQMVKVFSLEGKQLSIIRYYPTFMAQRIGSVSCLTFHPYKVLLAAGAADACVSIYADEDSQLR
ncbi:unnamed protein product [Spirodela intermedia]|uniref:Raptor N-terminal CASPase-like domain-containing protein n=1 Tax=Spirodela intermedia TaxID=51605 RepID=A0A7I8ICS9_SPIIN|nr:unnamed protein product [Spirodela intermedia]CAA6654661.1 unnamed protein product [Spirodela intermedia]